MNFKTKLIQLLTSVLLIAGLASAQTTITSTTANGAITATATSIVVTSATGFAAGYGLYIDAEYMLVASSYVSGTTVPVLRGRGPTRAATHKTLSVIWVATPIAFKQTTPQGQCTKTSLLYVPWINITNNEISNCLGLTTAGQWALVNRPGTSVVGTTVASATTIVPTGTFFVVSGTTAVVTITPPEGWGVGMSIDINPSGIFATTTAGNIGLVSSASVVGRILRMTWDGSKWWPSYVS